MGATCVLLSVASLTGRAVHILAIHASTSHGKLLALSIMILYHGLYKHANNE